MQLLTEIQIRLPSSTFEDDKSFIDLFSDLASTNDNHIGFPSEPPDYIPIISIQFTDITIPEVLFLSNHSILCTLSVKNETDEEWDSPYKYTPIDLNELTERMSSNQIHFLYYDHLGVNIPSLQNNIKLRQVQQILKDTTLLHNFPDEPRWKFIIPASENEISNRNMDYNLERRPKFEFVDFDTCSKPILQIDLAVGIEFNRLKEIFPEAIHDDQLQNLWIYIKNNSSIDICVVFNQPGEGWTDFFEGQLI